MKMVQQVSIIGAGGKMGSWFSRYFSEKLGTKVLAYDTNALWRPPTHVTLCSNVNSCVSKADLVLVCVPIISTPSVIKSCALNMKSGAVLAEISSIKAKTFWVLKKYSNRIFPLCIHPMFGPGASSISNTRTLLVPVKNKKTESDAISSLMRGSEIIVLPSPQVHDKSMAIILGLTYFVNMVLAKILSKEDILYLEKIAGTFFGIQLLLMQGIISDDPGLIVSIISRNSHTKKRISEYLSEADALRSIILGGRDNELLRDLSKVKSIFERSFDLEMSYRNMYTLFRKQKGIS